MIQSALIRIKYADCDSMNVSTIRFKVEGMMCEACSSKVEEALGSIPGVESAAADHRKGVASAEYGGSIDDETFLMAIIDAGFKAKVKRGLFR